MRALGAALAIGLVGCASLAGIGDPDQAAPDPVSPSDDPATAAPKTQAAPVDTANSSGGGAAPTQTQTQTTTDAGSDTGTTTPATPAKKSNGEDCNGNDDCKSDKCSDELDICVKKGHPSLGCLKQEVTCAVFDDICCGNDYCAGTCKACKQAGENPDPARGADSCCTGVIGSNGKCR